MLLGLEADAPHAGTRSNADGTVLGILSSLKIAMPLRSPPKLHFPRRGCLATCLAAALASGESSVIAAEWRAAADPEGSAPIFGSLLAHAARQPTTVIVSSCDDNGPGTLRDAVQNFAADGDEVDLSELNCSTISLTTGAIIIGQDSLTIHGPGRDLLTIDGAANPPGYGVLFHNGSGTLVVDNLTVSHGAKYSTSDTIYPNGGCIYSGGNVSLSYATISGCSATAAGNTGAMGGGVYTHGDLSLSHTIVTGNLVQAAIGYYGASGGGIYVHGNLAVGDSEISRNQSLSGFYLGGACAGVSVLNNATFADSSILENSAQYSGGGICVRNGPNLAIIGSTIANNTAYEVAGVSAEHLQSTHVYNSTLSGNVANHAIGGAALAGDDVTIANSTIAFNRADRLAGLYLPFGTLRLESSILADNAGADAPDDFDMGSQGTLTGTNNLITGSHANIPPDTITACPHLQPLANNGGPTLTHALLQSSPAIDAGNNDSASNTDQRGSGFPRVFGPAADIGAFEWQGGSDDGLFNSGFELLCDQ